LFFFHVADDQSPIEAQVSHDPLGNGVYGLGQFVQLQEGLGDVLEILELGQRLPQRLLCLLALGIRCFQLCDPLAQLCQLPHELLFGPVIILHAMPVS
jgi:hypothetical protein